MEIQKRKKVEFQYFIYCPACNKEVKGISVKHVESNIHSHLETHSGDKK
ncbi:hypothetical protein LCGC14_0852450 [marine sediment metagenome]|uniref:C2H2-type domain-containing protein n=1 Tax=marine sediment metagenome TaxID=412755 RepID=A0A0F9P9S8_9ZZZZ